MREALEFVLAARVRRYGQGRRFEVRPDGIVLPARNFYALYDAKAYGKGYKVTQDGLRQFGSYVEDVSARSGTYLGRLNSFLVVSGEFTQGEKALERRSREFVARHGVLLSFLTADALGEMVEMLSKTPVVRRAIDWSAVFADPVARAARVKKEVRTVLRDEAVS